jgi:hypothetical protein
LVTSLKAQALYNIAEPDVLDEIESKKNKVIEEAEKFHQILPEKIRSVKAAELLPAPKTYTYYVDITYTLPEDLTDENGKVIYPKGYTFNPIAYTNVKPPDLVIFNPCDKKESAFVKKLVKNIGYYILVGANCTIGGMADFLTNAGHDVFQQPVYMVNEQMKQKLDLKYTVSVVSVDLDVDYIKVDVYKVRK